MKQNVHLSLGEGRLSCDTNLLKGVFKTYWRYACKKGPKTREESRRPTSSRVPRRKLLTNAHRQKGENSDSNGRENRRKRREDGERLKDRGIRYFLKKEPEGIKNIRRLEKYSERKRGSFAKESEHAERERWEKGLHAA